VISDEELAWVEAHMSDLRGTVADRRIRYWTLWTALGTGLVVHVAGFLLKSSATGEPISVLGDLLYTLGYALWTGVVVVAVTDIIPAAKERQVSRALDRYEAALRSRAHSSKRPPESSDGRQQ
jgi:hypothetical protein